MTATYSQKLISTIAKYWFILVLALAGSIIFSVNFILILVSFAVVYMFCYRYFRIGGQESSVWISVVSLTLTALLILTVSSSAGYLFGDYNIQLTPGLTVTILLTSILLAKLQRSDLAKNRCLQIKKHLTKADLISISGALVVVSAVVLSPLVRGGILPSDMISLIDGGVDDSVHLALLNDRIDFNQSNFADMSPSDIRTSDKLSYPAGWHTANAILITAIAPKIDLGTESTLAYVITKVFWFFIMCFLLIRTSLYFSGRVRTRGYAFVLALGIIFCYVFAVPQFAYGFYNFIPLVISLTLISVVTLKGINSLSTHNNPDIEKLLILATLCLAGGISWLLLVPTMTLGVLACVYLSYSKNNPKDAIAILFSSMKKYPLIYGILVATVLGQIYISALSESSVSFIDDLMLSGQVAQYSWPVILTVIVGLFAYATYLKKSSDTSSQSWWIIASLLATAGCIYLLQLAIIEKPAYYFYKVIIAAILAAMPLVIAGYCRLYASVSSNTSPATYTAFGICLISVFAIIAVDNSNLSTSTLKYVTRPFQYSAEGTLNTYRLLTDTDNTNRASKSYTIFFKKGQTNQNFTYTMLAKSNAVDSKCFRSVLGGIVFGDNTAQAIATPASHNCNKEYISVITTPGTAYELSRLLGDKANISIKPTLTE